MLKNLFCLVCVAVCLSVAGAFAQSSPTPSPKPTTPDLSNNPPLDASYVLALSSADKKGEPEFCVLVAAQNLSVFDEPRLTFNAEIFPQENGSFLLYYTLVQSGTTTKTTVILRPGEPVQILKNGDQLYNLRLDRYNSNPANPH